MSSPIQTRGGQEPDQPPTSSSSSQPTSNSSSVPSNSSSVQQIAPLPPPAHTPQQLPSPLQRDGGGGAGGGVGGHGAGQPGESLPPPPTASRNREKKRVGFLSDHQPSRGSSPGPSRSRGTSPGRSPSAFSAQQQDSSAVIEDYFSSTPQPGSNGGTTPTGGAFDPPGHRDSFNKEELTAALSQIFSPNQQQLGVSVPRPRPVLRKHAISDYAARRGEGGGGGGAGGAGAGGSGSGGGGGGGVGGGSEPQKQPHRSEVEAKNRADRLAVAVGSSSAPVSRRASLDEEEEEEEEDDSTSPGTPYESTGLTGNNGLKEGATSSHDFAPQVTAGGAPGNGLRPRRGTNAQFHHTANKLVRSHTRRGKSPSPPTETPPPEESGHISGTATPVAYDLEYVPRPEKYKGGVLGNLLKLYNAEDQFSPGGGSSTPSTPSRTPRSSPPTSAPPTPRTEKPPRLERPRSGFWNRHNNNPSSSTLAGLIGSSATLAASTAGSGREFADAVTEKMSERLRQERKQVKRQKTKLFRKLEEEKYLITNHIAEILSRHTYLVKLCKALMSYGAPSHRLEAYMAMSARVLSIEGQFLYLPGTMIISFDDRNTHTTEVKIVRAVQGVDLGRLLDTHELYKEVVHDVIGVEEATARLDAITARKPKFPIWFRVLLYGIASASVAPFGFEGRYIDMPIAFLLGLIVGMLQLVLAPSNELYANVFEITAALITAFLSRMFGSLRGGTLFCFSSLAQSSIALILPGYIVLCSSLELISHQMVAGSVRMVYALIYTLFLGYGITIGSVIYGYIDPNAVSQVHCDNYDAWYEKMPNSNYYPPFVLVFTLCLCAINQAKWKQTPVMVFISLAGYVVNNKSSNFFQDSSQVSGTLGALTIGVLANLYSRLGRYVDNFALDVWERYLEHHWNALRGVRRPRYVYGSPPPSSPFPRASDPDPEQPATDTKEGDPVGGDVDGATLSAGTGGGGGTTGPPVTRHARKIGYGLAAAAMLPAIFVQVPSGLAAGGSLLSGVTNADQITHSNQTILANGTVVNTTSTATTTASSGDLNSTAFNVLLSVIQVAISISVGLSLSALIVYPFGKRRSGLFSF